MPLCRTGAIKPLDSKTPIQGEVVDPKLTLDNPEIARRHIRAFLLQNYHQDRLPAVDTGRRSRSVQANDVNWLPWSVFMISGGPNVWMASFSASIQKSASSVLEMRHDSTLRVWRTG